MKPPVTTDQAYALEEEYVARNITPSATEARNLAHWSEIASSRDIAASLGILGDTTANEQAVNGQAARLSISHDDDYVVATCLAADVP